MPSFSKYIAELELVQSQYFTDNGDGTIDVRGDGLEDQNGDPVSLGGGTIPTGSSGKGYINVAVSETVYSEMSFAAIVVDVAGKCIAKLNADLGAGNWTYPVTVGLLIASPYSSNCKRIVYNNHELVMGDIGTNTSPTGLVYVDGFGYDNGTRWDSTQNPHALFLTVDNATDWPAVAIAGYSSASQPISASNNTNCTIQCAAASEFGTYSAPGTGTLNSSINQTILSDNSSAAIVVDVAGIAIAQLNADHGAGNWTYPCVVNLSIAAPYSSNCKRIVYNNHELSMGDVGTNTAPNGLVYVDGFGYDNGTRWDSSQNPHSLSLTVNDATDWPAVAIAGGASPSQPISASNNTNCTVQSVTATPYP